MEDDHPEVEDELRDEIIEDDPVELEEEFVGILEGITMGFCELGGGRLGVPETRMRIGKIVERGEEVCFSLALACSEEGVM